MSEFLKRTLYAERELRDVDGKERSDDVEIDKKLAEVNYSASGRVEYETDELAFSLSYNDYSHEEHYHKQTQNYRHVNGGKRLNQFKIEDKSNQRTLIDVSKLSTVPIILIPSERQADAAGITDTTYNLRQKVLFIRGGLDTWRRILIFLHELAHANNDSQLGDEAYDFLQQVVRKVRLKLPLSQAEAKHILNDEAATWKQVLEWIDGLMKSNKIPKDEVLDMIYDEDLESYTKHVIKMMGN